MKLAYRSALYTLSALCLLACGDSSTQPGTDPNTITVQDDLFSPDPLTVTAGTVVTWTWAGGLAHNVTSDDGSFTSSETQATGTHVVTFGTAGTFHYHCTIHGTATSGMRGAVIVQASSPAN